MKWKKSNILKNPAIFNTSHAVLLHYIGGYSSSCFTILQNYQHYLVGNYYLLGGPCWGWPLQSHCLQESHHSAPDDHHLGLPHAVAATQTSQGTGRRLFVDMTQCAAGLLQVRPLQHAALVQLKKEELTTVMLRKGARIKRDYKKINLK